MKKIIKSLLLVSIISYIFVNCGTDSPTPSTPALTTKKVTSDIKSDVKAVTKSSAKVSNVRAKTTSISNKVNKKARLAIARRALRTDSTGIPNTTFPGLVTTVNGNNANNTIAGIHTAPGDHFITTYPGGNYTFTGDNGGYPEFSITDTGISFDTTGLGGAVFTNGEIALLNNELNTEFGGKTSVTIIGGNMHITIDYGTATDNPDKSADAPTKISGKMILKMDINGGTNLVTTVQFIDYKEDYKNDSLDYTMDGVMTMGFNYSSKGTDFTSTSTFDITTKQNGITTIIIGNSSITGTSTDITENGTYKITEGSESFDYEAKNVKIPLAGCDKNFGVATSGTATIKEGDEVLTIDYGTGTCDSKVKIIVGTGDAAVSEEIDLYEGDNTSVATTSGTNLK